MNRQLIRLFGVTAAGFVLLLGFTTYWQLWASSSLAARQDNLHEVVPRAVDRSRAHPGGERRGAREERGAEDGRRAAHLRAALSARPGVRARDGLLVADVEPQRSRAVAERLPDRLELGPLGGARARVPLDHRRHRQGQRRRDLARPRGAGGRVSTASRRPAFAGAAVAIDPATGKVLALVSSPSYNPNAAVRGTAAWFRTLKSPSAPLLNRVTQGRYPPGSTFKVITATAALASGKFTPDQPLRRHRDVHRVRAGDPQRQRRAVRRDRSVERAHALDQHDLRADRLGALRAQQHLSAAAGRDVALRHVPARRRSTCRRTRSSPRASRPRPPGPAPAARREARPRAHGDRPVHARGHAAPDGDGRRGDRQRRRADAPDARRPRASGPGVARSRRRSRRATGARRRRRSRPS